MTSIPAANITDATVPGIPAGTVTASAVELGVGAEVDAAPTLKNVFINTIEVNPVTITNNPGNQEVEYGYTTGGIVPYSGWQTGTTFSGLNPSTTYYIGARSKSNNNYRFGATAIKSSDPITTLATTAKTIMIGDGVPGLLNSIDFPITTTNIANGTTGNTGRLTDASGGTGSGFTTISVTVSDVQNNAATVSISSSTGTIPAGTRYFTVTIGGVTSAVKSFTI